jgi:hypothetical protein
MDVIRLPDLPFVLSRPFVPEHALRGLLVEPFVLSRLKAVSKDLWA